MSMLCGIWCLLLLSFVQRIVQAEFHFKALWIVQWCYRGLRVRTDDGRASTDSIRIEKTRG